MYIFAYIYIYIYTSLWWYRSYPIDDYHNPLAQKGLN